MTRADAPGPGGRTIRIDDAVLDPWGERLAALRTADAAHAADAADAPGQPARLAFAAAHVVMRDSYRGVDHALERPGTAAEIAEHVDWPATMALRRHLDAHGFGVAEAMDTAQRFFLGWEGAERLIRSCGALGLRHGFVAGAGVDHLRTVRSAADLIDGVVHQGRSIQAAGGLVIVLPMVWLCESRASEADYVHVYREIFRQIDGPLFVHWLGAMFLPALDGYFPGDSFARVMALDPDRVRGCKLSLLDPELEVRVRRELLPRGQVVLTGDDFHFARLILGGDADAASADIPAVSSVTELGGRRLPLGDFSHALLGVLDGIAEPASLALELLAHGDGAGYLEVMAPCERLGRHLFEEPTRHYKAGLACLAWLSGQQPNFMLVNHEQRARSLEHYLRAAELAAAAGALADAGQAAERLADLVARPEYHLGGK